MHGTLPRSGCVVLDGDCGKGTHVIILSCNRGDTLGGPETYGCCRLFFPHPCCEVSYSRAACLASHMGGCQNYGPFFGPYYNTAPNISGIQKGTLILTTTHMIAKALLFWAWETQGLGLQATRTHSRPRQIPNRNPRPRNPQIYL